MNSLANKFLADHHVSVKVENTEEYVQCLIGNEDDNEKHSPTSYKTEHETAIPKDSGAPLCWTIKDNVVWCSRDRRNVVVSSENSKETETCYSHTQKQHDGEYAEVQCAASLQRGSTQNIILTEKTEQQIFLNFSLIRNCPSSENINDTSDLGHKCDKCGKGFKYHCKLAAHQKAHSSEKPFSCSVCSKQFARKSDHVRHEWIHKKGDQLNVEENSSDTVQNIGKQKKIKFLTLYNCDVCGKQFSYHYSVKRHQKVHFEKPNEKVPKDTTVYNCTMCGMTFTRHSYLLEHVKIHTGYTLYICKECGKRFVSSSSLARHQNTHTERNPYSSDGGEIKCGKT
ncbi:zinc finger protein 134-like [Pelobates fuscus]|uniref:zinc finger protein 134-like n=1 Tax=Pelobates fuscus TaxID=191477 RepID=UPI002FE4C98A